MSESNGWGEWSRHVLAELTRLNSDIEKLEKCVTDNKLDINAIKIKAGLWGALTGAVPAIIMLVVWLVNR